MGKSIVIGIDAANWDILNELLKKDKIPNLRRIIESGISGNLKSTIPPLTPPAWYSMVTGVNPGKHGIYDFIEEDNQHKISPIKNYNGKFPTLWDIYSFYNKRVIIVNFPISYPPPKVNGIFISGILAPENGDITYPDTLKKLLRDYNYRIHINTEKSFEKVGYEEYTNHLKQLLEIKFNLYAHLMKNYDWDLFFGVFNEIDWAQHYLWDSDKLYQIYIYFDFLLGKFLEKVEEDEYNLLIVSDHGMKKIRGEIHFNNLLERWGYLKRKKSSKIKSNIRSIAGDFIYYFLNTTYHLHQLISKDIRNKEFEVNIWKKKLLGLIKQSSKSTRNRTDAFLPKFFKQINWDKTKAYSYGNFGKIYLRNINNSEINDLKNKLTNLCDPFNKDVIFSSILEKNEIYKGSNTDKAPDLILIPNKWDYNIQNNFGKKWINLPRSRLADHSQDGIYILNSPKLIKNKKKNLSIVDIFPLILGLNDIPIPSYVDGEVPSFIKSNSVYNAFESIKISNERNRHREKDDELEKEAKKRLNDLGYL